MTIVPSAADPTPSEDRFGHVEAKGVEYLPESERDSRPRNMLAVFFGGNLAFSVIVFGWLPITFGLSWIGAVTASAAGITLGTLLIAPMALMGPRTGTNNTVSSGAHFGVTGRLIGSTLTLMFALAYAAIAVWTSGDALIVASHRLFGTPVNHGMLAIGYGIIAAEIVVVALFGHGTVVALQKFVLPIVGILLLLGFMAFGGKFESNAGGDGHYLLVGFWQTWALAVAMAAGGPLSYAPTLGDYSRRISRSKFSDRSVVIATMGGIFFGLLLTAAFGSFTASTFTTLGDSYVADLVAESPDWYVVPIVLIALAGGLGQGVLNVFDLEALIPRLKRVQTTLITSGLAVVLLYIGVFVVKAVDSITAMTLVLNGLAAPWVAINVVGFLVARRGEYHPADLQVFNQGRRGGRYWFTGGWNLRAVIPWLAGSLFGILTVDTSLYPGPLAYLANGIDISLVGSAAIAAIGYLAALRIWPERVAPVDADSC
ncbi:purine-cytosine permease family protein [Mycobacterium montefiorense]|uniref:Purine/cytosine permease n=1 Tax=Mycobacterium montefiorense TaxID=154654 RepID=A0AA37UTU9_9MYCO|nr:cytosine permease [Mycobacterium montefiorense]GBG38994.1 putative purine/cytosine permease [Mycobacterium montefiorense]GKU32782.1 putative purine/cytosine permease [Mycobacterium montefiorense]GKU38304.1 putative purine/cytosine permease [Mycobacterium montefiorense]GKU47450.1 putative purine/cytosine permease [Mycobacterium montefiorense]GKU50333.1 putative purine/cytosine permease [Mycobacterium montefiorense]